MTPLMQRGYDDQARGAIDPALDASDTLEGREYRDGARQARRDAFDAEADPLAQPVAEFAEPPRPPADSGQLDLL